MNYSDDSFPMEFKLEGQFLGFVHRDGKPKYVRLQVSSEEIQIKLPKAMQSSLDLSFQLGEAIWVSGIGKRDHHTHELKLKADQITPLIKRCPPSEVASLASILSSQTNDAKRKTNHRNKVKVLVCQKSGCLKKGGKGLCEALAQILRDRSLDQYVSIERTGCVKRCSAAPNLVIMPGNHRYTDVRPKTLPQIAEAIAQGVARI